MSDLVQAVPEVIPAQLSRQRNGFFARLLRKDVSTTGPAWLPIALVLGAIVAVAHADRQAVAISLAYLYILPLGLGAIFLRRSISYSLIAVCILLHDYDSPRKVNLVLRTFDNLLAMLFFICVVYFIQRYMEQREALARTVQRQRDGLLQDLELAAQVQRLFLPVGKPSIAGLEIAGMMQPARGVSGDYYDYIPIDGHTIQLVVADVAGKGVPAALLMSATAAAMQLEANHDRDIREIVGRLNTSIRSVSDGERYVTLLVAEIDVRTRKLQYVNCGHNPALVFRTKTATLTRMNSSCPPIGLFSDEICELTSAHLAEGDVLVFYTDGLVEAANKAGEEFGTERLSALVRRNSLLSAENLMLDIFNSAVDFRGETGFDDDVTILVVKCQFEAASAMSS